MKTQNTLLAICTFIAFIIGACKPSTNTANTQSAGDRPLLKGTLSDTTARRLVHNFNGRAHMIRTGKDGKGLLFPDTRSVWFSIEQLSALVDKIKREKGDGIRFYFAAYDSLKKEDTKDIKDQYQNYSTLIMVSTKEDSLSKAHMDYYKDVPSKGSKGAIIMSVPENQGELCPPPANCATAGATLLSQ